MSDERDIFQPYLERRYKQERAMTFGQKQAVITRLKEETKQGKIPIGGDQVIKLNPDSTAVKAIREGKQISLTGKGKRGMTAGSAAGKEGQDAARKRALIAVPLLILIPLILCAVWWFLPASALTEEEISGTAVAMGTVTVTQTISPTMTPTVISPQATATAPPTMTPIPTFTPVPIVAEEAYVVQVDADNPVGNYINPVSLLFAGTQYQVTTAELAPEWQPEGVEWWPGTDIRRVFAVPYQESVLAEAFAHLGETITVRLRTGAAISYRLEDIEQIHELQIEMLTSDSPSIALVLYGVEESSERWFITGSAVQTGGGAAAPRAAERTSQQLARVHSCQLSGQTMTCTMQLTAEHYLTDLRLTDSEWVEVADHLPAAEVTRLDENLTVQIAGSVRSPETAVLLWRKGGETVEQQIPLEKIQPNHSEEQN